MCRGYVTCNTDSGAVRRGVALPLVEAIRTRVTGYTLSHVMHADTLYSIITRTHCGRVHS